MDNSFEDECESATGGDDTEDFKEQVRTNPVLLIKGKSLSPDPSPSKKKGKLQRSERLQSDSSNSSMSSWEALLKESFGHVAWPIKIKSWELVDDRGQKVPYR